MVGQTLKANKGMSPILVKAELEKQISPENARRRRVLIKLAAEQDDLCFYCDKPVLLPDDPSRRFDNSERNGDDEASYDHVIPKYRNGRGGINLVVAHRSCNSHRGRRDLTEEETDKLNRLNERRKHLFDAQSGNTDPATFGIVTWSSIVLADKVDDPETPNGMRGRICKFCQRYKATFRGLRLIADSDQWQYLSNLVLQDYLIKLEANDFMYKTYIASILKAVRMEHMRRRFKLPKFQKLSYDPNEDGGTDERAA